ncbi:hypothetical protein DCE79_11080 [Lysinibacillus sp. 2017]|uniref:hypothetical protein n=1 Tax=unclassified Lysinibacillus TaxID=2636778 RepID=UPI000D526F9C|nr:MULTISPECIES: hypothetical protein [unclassified Lysinibacillus]AWE07895.1 hypothetical protein DCE79_11080 [Lysinibacillus sp. 2017]TGN33157.1 hypothetical protein E4L99_15055 [Lysinibacillus sp. S2017]
MTIPKIKQGEVLKVTAFKNPGSGAIEFARRYIGPGHDYEEMLEIMSAVIDGHFAEIHDKKVKRCQCCGFYYRDKTKNNSGTTCSRECKAIKDSVLKTYARRVRAEEKGTTRKSYKDGRYYGGEYSFWCNEQAMFEYDRKRSVYTHGNDFEEVVAAAQRRLNMGGKKRITTDFNLYEDDWSTAKYKPSMEFYGDTKATGGSVTIIKRSREEIEADLLGRYGEKHLLKMRKRALDHTKIINRI